MTGWRPSEIIINEKVLNDSVTDFFLSQCPDTPTKTVENGSPRTITEASEILKSAGKSMLDKILAGKRIVYIGPASDVVDVFEMPDSRMKCPHFERLKLASNGCFYQCDWCYLKLTYRAAFPYIAVRAEYDNIKSQLMKRLSQFNQPVMFNSGELADSLAMEHLTRAGREFIPWFGQSENGYLFMLTKSDNVDDILDMPHNEHTIIAWSMNNGNISRKYEIGAPSFERRLEAAVKVENAGYPVRIRLDPIVPFQGWQEEYKETIRQIFEKISPERITIGTLRFEPGFYNMRNSFFTTGPDLPSLLEQMTQMFPPETIPGFRKPKSGKYSFSEERRVEIFDYIIKEIRKVSDCRIALCKESAPVWNRLNLDLSNCGCVCQFDSVDISDNHS